MIFPSNQISELGLQCEVKPNMDYVNTVCSDYHESGDSTGENTFHYSDDRKYYLS